MVGAERLKFPAAHRCPEKQEQLGAISKPFGEFSQCPDAHVQFPRYDCIKDLLGDNASLMRSEEAQCCLECLVARHTHVCCHCFGAVAAVGRNPTLRHFEGGCTAAVLLVLRCETARLDFSSSVQRYRGSDAYC